MALRASQGQDGCSPVFGTCCADGVLSSLQRCITYRSFLDFSLKPCVEMNLASTLGDAALRRYQIGVPEF
eukprot:3311266-Pyramimonas_sp.AAC.1